MKRSREPEDDLDPDSQEADAEQFAGSGAQRSPAKISELDSAVADDNQDGSLAMRCSLPPHKQPVSFKSYGDYENHYHQFHTNRCLECHKNFPSDHLLGVHIEEFHDSLMRVRRDKGEHTYSCFVEGCERKCMTHQKRRMHMIDKHMYPKNFFFAVTRDGIDGRGSLLVDSCHHRRRSSASTQSKETRRRANTLDGSQAKNHPAPPSPDKGAEKPEPNKKDAADTDMADLTGAMSALQFVPSSIRFGRGRAGFARS
ncbi:Zinc finger protein [Tolypocladium ophioglossoides CBS 100239]|uniref:Zinc finger protein n=1 Tax=Tolypocladium ophioglossoides (strain CBS 100239) TaxID=1163406 RepID=A0A0L0NKP6_TOLOC|nr:Zinc finger protein [Tolypocladium ophioglossoides CBS 100239]